MSDQTGWDQVKRRTLCPFAPGSLVSVVSGTQQARTLQELGELVSTQAHDYVQRLNAGKFSDGLVAPLPIRLLAVRSIDGLVAAFRELHDRLVRLEGLTPNAAEIGTAPWQLTLWGERMFTIVFSPTYPSYHHRYSPDKDNAFVLFQPETSFHIRLDRRRMSLEKRERLKYSIRRSFAAGGQPYRDFQDEPRIEARRYIRAVDPDGEYLEWWRS